MKFGIIKERKTPPDRRVVFSPQKLKEVTQLYPEAHFVVEPSDIRIFSDAAYRDAGFQVSDDLSECEVLLGVKEVPIEALIPNKSYFFFSHTIKKQPYNRDLLRANFPLVYKILQQDAYIVILQNLFSKFLD